MSRHTRSLFSAAGISHRQLPRKIQLVGKERSTLQRIHERERCCAAYVEVTSLSKQFYDPVTLSVMTDAFDRSYDFLRTRFGDSDNMRRRLALHIIREVDNGESDPTRLATLAILSVLNVPPRRVQ